MNDSALLEKLSALEHDQWIHWSRAVASEVSTHRRGRWETYWVPYDELSEEVKEFDRKWARKILAVVESHVTGGTESLRRQTQEE